MSCMIGFPAVYDESVRFLFFFFSLSQHMKPLISFPLPPRPNYRIASGISSKDTHSREQRAMDTVILNFYLFLSFPLWE